MTTATEDPNQDPLAEEADRNGRTLALRRVQEMSFWQWGGNKAMKVSWTMFA